MAEQTQNLTSEDVKKALDQAFESFRKSLGNVQTKEGAEIAFNDFKKEIETKYASESKQINEGVEKLSAIVKSHGEKLAGLSIPQNNENQSFKNLLITQKGEFEKMSLLGGAGQINIKTTCKDVLSSNISGNTNGVRIPGIGEIHRGNAYLRDILNVVPLGANSNGSVRWFEQTAITNNATNVSEKRTVGAQSGMTWAEKTIGPARIFDWLKIGIDTLKDTDLLTGEIQRLVSRNMRLKENAQLLSGTGVGNEIQGVLGIAKEFVTSGIKIQEANFVDLIGKIATQIDTDMMSAAMPNYFIANRNDTDTVRFAKTRQGAYLFPQWMFSPNISVGSVTGIENPLVTADSLLVGDFSLATLYVWDDLLIEIAQIDDDKLTGMTTIMAYQRENLRIQDVDKTAFVKVTSIADTLTQLQGIA